MNDATAVELLDLPHPYSAMVAICSDLDETPSADVYLETSRFLNTGENTRFGKGMNLEVGNTIYFYMAPTEFSYWNTSDKVRSRIRDLIRSGHVDCIHSWGDLATERRQAGETLEHLAKNDCRFRVWIDHAIAPSNFGADIMQGSGDLPGSAIYHSDLTLAHGIRYVWRGRVTSMQGQDAPASLAGIWRGAEPVGSLVTLSKEAVKVAAARLGSSKYALHRHNRVLADATLRDSSPVLEFLRTNPHPLGVSAGDTASGLGRALSASFLDRLVRRRAKAVVYTHLGKRLDPQSGIPDETRQSLERLADRMRRGQVLVTTTARLLEYTRLVDSLSWQVEPAGDCKEIVIQPETGIESLHGLGFSVPAGSEYRIVANGRPLETTRIANGAKDVLHVPWRRLTYAD